MKLGFKAIALAALLGSSLYLSPVALAQTQQTTVPDAPAPQAPPPLSGVNGPITPGQGAEGMPGSASDSSGNPSRPQPVQRRRRQIRLSNRRRRPAASRLSSQPPSSQVKDDIQTTAPELGAAAITKYVVNVNFVEVPVTVKDAKGNLVAGLTWRDFKVFENNTRVQLRSSPSIPPRSPLPL